MSDEPIEVVRRLLEAQKRDDLPAALGCLHPDVEWIPLRAATEGAYRGHEGVERFYADTKESFEAFEPHFELRDLGDRVLAWGTIHVRGIGSGVETDIPTGGVFEVREGRVVRWQDFGSREKALEAVGVSEGSRPRISRERFEAFLGALNSRDFDAVAALLTFEVAFRSLVGGSEGGEPYSGIEGLREWAKDVDAVWEDWHQEIVEFREVNRDQAVMILRATGRAKASGVPLDTLSGNVLTWRDDKGWEMVAYTDPREAFEAVGLPGVAMSEENVEIIRRGYAHWYATGEIRAHPDFVWDVSNLGWPDQQIYLGAEGANRFNAEWAEAWDDWKLAVEDLIEAGEKVVAIVNQQGRSKSTGIPVDMRFAQVWTFRDGQAIRMQMYASVEEALEAVGL